MNPAFAVRDERGQHVRPVSQQRQRLPLPQRPIGETLQRVDLREPACPILGVQQSCRNLLAQQDGVEGMIVGEELNILEDEA